MTLTAHEHGWRDSPAVVRQRKVDHSPVSHGDCYVRTEVLLVQTCDCGDVRQVRVGVEDAKRGCWS